MASISTAKVSAIAAIISKDPKLKSLISAPARPTAFLLAYWLKRGAYGLFGAKMNFII